VMQNEVRRPTSTIWNELDEIEPGPNDAAISDVPQKETLIFNYHLIIQIRRAGDGTNASGSWFS